MKRLEQKKNNSNDEIIMMAKLSDQISLEMYHKLLFRTMIQFKTDKKCK